MTQSTHVQLCIILHSGSGHLTLGAGAGVTITSHLARHVARGTTFNTRISRPRFLKLIKSMRLEKKVVVQCAN